MDVVMVAGGGVSFLKKCRAKLGTSRDKSENFRGQVARGVNLCYFSNMKNQGADQMTARQFNVQALAALVDEIASRQTDADDATVLRIAANTLRALDETIIDLRSPAKVPGDATAEGR